MLPKYIKYFYKTIGFTKDLIIALYKISILFVGVTTVVLLWGLFFLWVILKDGYDNIRFKLMRT